MQRKPPPRTPKGVRLGGRQKGTQNKVTIEIRESSRALLESPGYRESLRRRLEAGRAPHMETILHHYAYGKPKETHEVTGKDGGPIEHKRIELIEPEQASKPKCEDCKRIVGAGERWCVSCAQTHAKT